MDLSSPDITKIQMDEDLLIMANSYETDYALTYKITIDEKERKVRVVIEDLPVLGKQLVSKAETEGITVSASSF